MDVDSALLNEADSASSESSVRERPTPGRGEPLLRGVARIVFTPLILLVIWSLASVWLSDAVPSPVATLEAIQHGLQAGWLGEALLITLEGTAIAFTLAAVVGCGLGAFMGLSRFWGEVLETPLVWFYAVPKVTLYPMFLLFLGLTVESRVVFAALHGFIPLALFILNGTRSVRPVHLKVARVYRLSRWQTVRRVVIPTALPTVVVGLQYCFSLTFIGLVFAELFAASEGTGNELILAIGLNRVEDTFGIALILSAFALAVNAAFGAVLRVAEARLGVTKVSRR